MAGKSGRGSSRPAMGAAAQGGIALSGPVSAGERRADRGSLGERTDKPPRPASPHLSADGQGKASIERRARRVAAVRDRAGRITGRDDMIEPNRRTCGANRATHSGEQFAQGSDAQELLAHLSRLRRGVGYARRRSGRCPGRGHWGGSAPRSNCGPNCRPASPCSSRSCARNGRREKDCSVVAPVSRSASSFVAVACDPWP